LDRANEQWWIRDHGLHGKQFANRLLVFNHRCDQLRGAWTNERNVVHLHCRRPKRFGRIAIVVTVVSGYTFGRPRGSYIGLRNGRQRAGFGLMDGTSE
jgi:hypothetical protein